MRLCSSLKSKKKLIQNLVAPREQMLSVCSDCNMSSSSKIKKTHTVLLTGPLWCQKGHDNSSTSTPRVNSALKLRFYERFFKIKATFQTIWKEYESNLQAFPSKGVKQIIRNSRKTFFCEENIFWRMLARMFCSWFLVKYVPSPDIMCHFYRKLTGHVTIYGHIHDSFAI